MWILVLALSTNLMNAQTDKGDMAAGLNLGVGFGDGFTNIGIGAKYQWTVINKLRLEPSFNYFLKKDYTSMWDMSVNAHYLFPLGGKFILYPLAGLGVQGVKFSYSAFGYSASTSDTQFAFNIGAGGEYPITDAISMNLEFKYKIASGWNRAQLMLGAVYHF